MPWLWLLPIGNEITEGELLNLPLFGSLFQVQPYSLRPTGGSKYCVSHTASEWQILQMPESGGLGYIPENFPCVRYDICNNNLVLNLTLFTDHAQAVYCVQPHRSREEKKNVDSEQAGGQEIKERTRIPQP